MVFGRSTRSTAGCAWCSGCTNVRAAISLTERGETRGGPESSEQFFQSFHVRDSATCIRPDKLRF